jgi:DNA polymerase-3 subunit delta'
MTPEISASAEVLRRDDSDAPRFLLVRSARKLLRRFDPVLWEGDEKKLVKARAMMERLAETVDNILPGKALPEGKKLEKLLDSLVDDCAVSKKVCRRCCLCRRFGISPAGPFIRPERIIRQ